MPKLYFSKNVQNRLESLIKSLLHCVSNYPNYFSEDGNLSIKNISSTRNTASHLIVQAELQSLVNLVFSDTLDSQEIVSRRRGLIGDIRHDLKLLEAIGLLEDHRVKRQGNSTWHFTLKLCSRDPVANLTNVQSQWSLYKNKKLPHSSSEQGLEVEQAGLNSIASHQDWGNAPDITHFFGRTQELTTLEKWAIQDNCHLIGIVGMQGIGKTRLSIKLGKGGVGKTDLSLQLAKGIHSQFHFVIWRSLINAPLLTDLVTDLVKVLSHQTEVTLPTSAEQKISRLLHYLNEHKCLLILDNFESILERNGNVGNYRQGYEGYGQLLKQIGSVSHQSCVLLTSREEPSDLLSLEGKNRPVRLCT